MAGSGGRKRRRSVELVAVPLDLKVVKVNSPCQGGGVWQRISDTARLSGEIRTLAVHKKCLPPWRELPSPHDEDVISASTRLRKERNKARGELEEFKSTLEATVARAVRERVGEATKSLQERLEGLQDRLIVLEHEKRVSKGRLLFRELSAEYWESCDAKYNTPLLNILQGRVSKLPNGKRPFISFLKEALKKADRDENKDETLLKACRAALVKIFNPVLAQQLISVSRVALIATSAEAHPALDEASLLEALTLARERVLLNSRGKEVEVEAAVMMMVKDVADKKGVKISTT